jgi:hypothetical protein
LATIPRIVLSEQSTIFRQARLQIRLPSASSSFANNNKNNNATTQLVEFSAMMGEFGPLGEHHLEGAELVVSKPLTGKGGLSEETRIQILQRTKHQQIDTTNTETCSNSPPVILFMQRGDGLTFVEKAYMAQQAGATAVIIGNNTSSPWPYIMKDFKKEAEALGLSIPVAMIKEADSKEIIKSYQKQREQSPSSTTFRQCNLHITSQSHDCVVCCDGLLGQETVIQLPGCGHIFHEACAMAWLTTHNTCPYCRRELPTDDEEYERERRRQQRTHAGSSGTNNDTAGTVDVGFYG